MFSRWEGIVEGLSTFVCFSYLLQWGRTFHLRYGKSMAAFEIVQIAEREKDEQVEWEEEVLAKIVSGIPKKWNAYVV